MISFVFMGLFLLLVEPAKQLDGGDNIRKVEVFVGDPVELVCNLSFPFEWAINETKFNFNQLPEQFDAFRKNNVYGITITKASLWMNNTRFSCGNYLTNTISWMGLLIVNFTLLEPNNVTVEEGNVASFSCGIPVRFRDLITIQWKINELVYLSANLPNNIYFDGGSIHLYELSESNSGTRIQCLLRSNLLLLDDYYYSSIATLTVLSTATAIGFESVNTRCALINFNHQKLYFGMNSRIEWMMSACETCSQYEYEIIITNSTSRQTFTNKQSLHYEISKEKRSENFIYYINAIQGNRTCSHSEVAMKIDDNAETYEKHVMLDSTVCLTIQGDQLLWLLNPSSTAFCIIRSDADDDDSIRAYGCYKDQIYNVTKRDGKFCWNNLIATMNATKIYDISISSFFDNHSEVFSVRTYNKAYTIIIENTSGYPWISMAIFVLTLVLIVFICGHICFKKFRGNTVKKWSIRGLLVIVVLIYIISFTLLWGFGFAYKDGSKGTTSLNKVLLSIAIAISAMFLLIIFIVLLVIIFVALKRCTRNGNEEINENNHHTEIPANGTFNSHYSDADGIINSDPQGRATIFPPGANGRDAIYSKSI